MQTGFKGLLVWQKAFQLAKDVYQFTKCFPQSEEFGLVQQMRRAAVSVASNIAEGYGRGSSLDYARFLRMAYGSLCELKTQYLLATTLGYSDNVASIEGLMEEVSRMLYHLQRRRAVPGS